MYSRLNLVRLSSSCSIIRGAKKDGSCRGGGDGELLIRFGRCEGLEATGRGSGFFDAAGDAVDPDEVDASDSESLSESIDSSSSWLSESLEVVASVVVGSEEGGVVVGFDGPACASSSESLEEDAEGLYEACLLLLFLAGLT